MNKKRIITTVLLCFSLITIFSACSPKITNIHKIEAKYGSVNESIIYPSSINSLEIEQAYSTWNIFVDESIEVKGIKFDINFLDDSCSIPFTINSYEVKVEELLVNSTLLDIKTSSKVEIVFDRTLSLSTYSGDNSTLKLEFLSSGLENTDIKFKISDLEFIF